MMHRAIQLCSLSPVKCTNIQSIFWMIVLWWCSDPTSKHASPKYDFLPDAVNLLSFRLQVAVSHIALADDRTLYLTTRDVKKIMKIKVPEDASAVKLFWIDIYRLLCFYPILLLCSIIGYWHDTVICLSVRPGLSMMLNDTCTGYR